MSGLNVIRAAAPLCRALLANKKVSKKFFSALATGENLSRCSVNLCRAQMSSLAGPVKEDNILGSPFGDLEVIGDTLPEYIFKGCEEYGDLPAITCGSTGRTYSYSQCDAMIKRCGRALLEVLKLKPGDTIGLVLPNIPEFVAIIFGAMVAGLRVTFANPLYTADEISRQFINSEVKCIVTIDALLGRILEVKSHLTNYNSTIIIGEKKNYSNGIFTLASLLETDCQIDLPKVDNNSIALIPYSSGTTGLPKGVILTHKNLVVNLIQVKNPVFRKHKIMDGNRHSILTVPPFFHIYGFNGILNHNLTLGKNIVSIPKFTPEEYIKCLSKYEPKTLFVVPSLLAFLANHPSVTKDHLASVEDIMVGAAAVTESVAEKFLQKCDKTWDQIKLQQGYGMTESSPVILLTPYVSPKSKAMSAGQVLPGTECKIVSLTTGENQGMFQTGELMCRGPQVMQGYLYNEKATKETIDEDGWLHTGDVAYYDNDHFFYIVDRTKELIKVKGNQVSPTELESIIMELGDVADVAVVGIPDHLAGELPKAFIVVKQGREISSKKIYDWVAEKVVNYKRLDGGIAFISSIPRNPGGKILRNELKVLGDETMTVSQ